MILIYYLMPSTWGKGWNCMGQLGIGHQDIVSNFTKIP